MSWKHSVVRALGFTINGEQQAPQRIPQQNSKIEATQTGNDFPFESKLGAFLAQGFDAYTAEGDRQGYDDPSSKNWEKQVQLLKVQLDNNLKRELFIKENKYSILKEGIQNADDIVGEQLEFIMQLKRAENEVTFLNTQIDLVNEEKGWYLMLHEALHDGFQVGSKRKIDELNSKYGLV